MSEQARVAIVTGASRGLGKGIAVAFGEAGWTVYVTGRGETSPTDPIGGTVRETAELVDAAGGRGIVAVCDQRTDAEFASVVERVRAEQGRLDILVNNAFLLDPSFFSGLPFWERPLSDWDMVDIGLRSHWSATVLAVPLMIDSGGGLIVNTSSFSERFGGGSVAYSVGKAGIGRLVRETGPELAPHNITTISFWPGLIATERTKAGFAADPDTFLGGVFALSDAETPEFSGRVILQMFADPQVSRFNGRSLVGAELAHLYDVTETDGRRPRSLRWTYGGGPLEG
jgi:NAD(P)-dependent dehydrogenase (short-subunit alcohol dehydrogenase family)